MRGSRSNVGDVNVSSNGYHYTRTEAGWRLTHHIIMESKLGRGLEPDERVVFKDGKRTNLDPDNIEISEKGRSSIRRRRAQLIARRDEIQAQIDAIDFELSKV